MTRGIGARIPKPFVNCTRSLRRERYLGLQTVFTHAIQRGQLPADFDVQMGTVTIFAMIHGMSPSCYVIDENRENAMH